MKIKRAILIMLAGCSCAATALAQPTIHFDQNRYDISPGQSFSVQVSLAPCLSSNLFSYGVRLLFPSTNAEVPSAAAISSPAAIDFNGVRGPGAVKELGLGSEAVKGTVDFAVSPLAAYPGSLL